MSALPPKADMCGATRHVRLDVDDQFEARRRLHWKVGRFLTFEDAIDVAGRAAVLVDNIGAIRHQPAGGYEKAEGVDRGHFVPRRERNDQFAIKSS